MSPVSVDDILLGASDPQARLEGVTSLYPLTDDDDFNALAAIVMEDSAGGTLFGPELVRHVLAARHARGARFHVRPESQPRPPGYDALFVVRRDGRLEPVTGDRPAAAHQGDTVVLLGPGRPEG